MSEAKTMWASILFILKRAFYFVIDNWKVVVPIFLVIVAVLFVNSYCAKRRVKLDERQQQEVARAIEEKNDAKLKEVLVEVEVKEAEIDANVANAQAATWAAQQNAREKYANMNTSELAAELEKRK